jgi:transketolase
MASDPDIVVLLGDIAVYPLRNIFEDFAERCFNMGVAEAGLVGFGAGLAAAGFYPIMIAITPFLVRRAYEQIYVDFGLNGRSGLIVGLGGPDDYAAFGPTHQCSEDWDLMACIPNMSVAIPRTLEAAGLELTRIIESHDLAYINLRDLND